MNWDDLNFEKKPATWFYLYCHSKLANVMFAYELARRYGKDGITAVSCNPGTVRTNIFNDAQSRNIIYNLAYKAIYPFLKILGKDPEQGAQTMIYCAVDDKIPNLNGKYFR
jgi:retinol dehydrogenase-12